MSYKLSIFFVSLFVFVLTSHVYSQNGYKVTYGISKPKLQGDTSKIQNHVKQMLKQTMSYAKKITYILTANDKESYFEQKDNLLMKSDSPLERLLFRGANRFTSFNKRTYVNYEYNKIYFVRNIANKDLVVKRLPYNFNWLISDEEKNVLGYTAKKALGTYYHPVTKENLKVVAWYLPSIPLKQGPDIFMGLPGLIVEVDIKGAIVTAKTIETDLNLEMKRIDDSEAMPQIEYEDLINKLTKDFNEEYGSLLKN